MLENTRIRDFINEDAYGEYLNEEFDRHYANSVFLNNKIDALTGKGVANGQLFLNATDATKLFLRKWSNYEVSGSNIILNAEQFIDFGAFTNIFLANGSAISSISQIQNKHMLILISDAGILQARIVNDALLPAASHAYENNVSLLTDFNSTTPIAFDSTKNGYYIDSKRVIATARISATSEVQFYYELGTGHRFKDVESLAVGQIFTETRWKREHPACYVPDGSTITNMNLEAPELFRILGTNILPDWRDRFARNIDLFGSRDLRDTQQHALQGHRHDAYAYTGGSEQGYLTFDNALDTACNYLTGLAISDGINGILNTANETRPENFAASIQIVRS